MSKAIGMMEGAYFVGRVELLNWLNDLLKLDYTKVEQTCSAAAYCQIMDAVYPGQIPLHKVNFNAKQEYEYVNNFKVLQSAFDKFGIDKHIDVAKLVKGKYQDNLEFLQWIKRYYDLHANTANEYNAVERRSASGVAVAAKPKPATTAATKAPTKTAAPAATKPKPTATATTTTTGAKPAVKAARVPVAKAAVGKDEPKVGELSQQVAELKLTIDGLEKERDFYFGKLREIEILCQQADQSQEVVQSVLRIMYATDENSEFVSEESEPAQDDTEETNEVAEEDDTETF